uniref:L1 transposable element RRM domain-containing protein n=1 Tax=Micrurus carvalhoi TaxID=3147026 RepID=A0A2H6N1Z6_9SAUR
MTNWNNIVNILVSQSKILKDMTIISAAALVGKTAKKTTSVNESPMITQKKIEEIQVAEKSSPNVSMQTQSTSETIQEILLKLQETIIKDHNETRTDTKEIKEEMKNFKTEVRSDIMKLDGKVDSIQKALEKNENKIKEVEKRTEKMEQEIGKISQQLKMINKEMENSFIQIEMEQAAFYLRFQNVEETKEDNLEMIMAELIAEKLEREKDEILNKLDDVYRVSTNYARRYRLPKEIHIRFARKKVCDILYKIAREEGTQYRGKEIQVLKQVPRRVREQRRDYRFLATYLNKKNILFRWLIPEGMLVTWEERRIRIDTLERAQEFYEQLIGPEESSSKEESESYVQEEEQEKTVEDTQ